MNFEKISRIALATTCILSIFLFSNTKVNAEEITYNNYKLIWSDDFNGNKLDSSKWKYGTVPENGSMKYLNSNKNVYLENGKLVLSAIPTTKYGPKFSATSGMVITQGLASWKYGRIDVRAKLPVEQGMWPAIWMMPEDNPYGWPNDGEIDIMEALGSEKNKIYGTLHSGNNTLNGKSTGAIYTLPHGTLADDYHVYSVIWKEKEFKFLIDNQVYGTITDWPSYFTKDGVKYKKDFPDPFNKPFYLMLNLGVGGGWGGEPNNTTKWGEKTKMYVDYVRVYQPK